MSDEIAVEPVVNEKRQSKIRTEFSLAVIAALLVIGQVLLIFVQPDPRSTLWEYIAIGYLLGTIWSHVALSAAWFAMGPFRLGVRMPLAAFLFAGGIIAFAGQTELSSGGADPDFLIVFSGCLLGEWLLLHIPFWIFVKFFRVRVEHVDSRVDRSDSFQFGIRQLFLLTTVSAVVFAVARFFVNRLHSNQQFANQEVIPIVFLTVAAMIMLLPLIVACLLKKYSLVATLTVLLLICGATWIEFPVLNSLMNTTIPSPAIYHIIAIDVAQTLWILIICSLLRWGGYTICTYSDASAAIFRK